VAELLRVREPSSAVVKEVFGIFDKDGNGTIGLEDIATVALQMGHYYSPERIKDILAAADINNHGSVMFNGNY